MNISSIMQFSILVIFACALTSVERGWADGEWEVAVKAEVPVKFRAGLVKFGDTSIQVVPFSENGTAREVGWEDLISLRRLPVDGAALPALKNNGEKSPSPIANAHGTGFRLELKRGGAFHGSLAEFGAEEIRFESDEFGDLEIPTPAVAAIVRSGSQLTAPKKGEGEEGYRVALENGEVVRGNLEGDSEPGWLKVTGKNATARFPYYLIGRIDFPTKVAGEQEDSGSGEEEKVKRFRITMVGGGEFESLTPELEFGQVVMTTLEGIRLRTRLEEVESVFPVVELKLPGDGGMLVWSGYSTKEGAAMEAWRRAMELAGVEAVEILEDVPDLDQFKEKLFQERVLFIPAMPILGAAAGLDDEVKHQGKTVARWGHFRMMRPVITEFLKLGGKVVIAGIESDDMRFLEENGIGDVSCVASTLIKGKILLPFREELSIETETVKFPAVTQNYKSDGWEIGIGTAKSSPLISKRVGEGRVTLFGWNFTNTDPEMEKLLGELLKP